MCVKRRRRDTQTVEKDMPRETQSDTYASLDVKSTSPEYDTLTRAGRDPNSDPYTSLDVQNRSSDYNTLTVVNRAARHTNTELQTSAQTPDTSVSLDAQNRSSDYENLMPGLIFKRREEKTVIFVFIVTSWIVSGDEQVSRSEAGTCHDRKIRETSLTGINCLGRKLLY
ncbi:hypothetical protein GN956_G25412 [Arapaima gigas]